MRIIQGLEAARSALLQHSAQDWPAETQETVRQIIQTVRAEGDEALLRYGRTLDGVELSGLEVRYAASTSPRERPSGLSSVGTAWAS
jgi:histidinol dehydrogenase